MGVAQPPQRGNVAFWRYPSINPKCGAEDGKLICIQGENLTNTLLASTPLLNYYMCTVSIYMCTVRFHMCTVRICLCLHVHGEHLHVQ